MKKKIFGTAIVALSLTAFAGNAQTPAADNGTQCGTSQCCKQKSDKQSCCGKQAVNPFDGLNLSDAQKTQLEQLKEKCQSARAEKAKAQKADRQNRADARRAEKKQYLEDVRAILGTDQYVVFLENMVLNGGGNNGKAGCCGSNGKHAKRPSKPGRHGDKGPRVDRNAAPESEANANS